MQCLTMNKLPYYFGNILMWVLVGPHVVLKLWKLFTDY